MKKIKNSKWLSYLLSKAEKLESEVCQQCNKNVLIREAVNCQFCNGFFHSKHFRVCKGGVAGIYTCYRCKDKGSIKNKSHQKKVVSKKKNSGCKNFKPLRNKRKGITVKSKKKPNGKKKSKSSKTKKNQSRKYDNIISCRKRKRTKLYYSFWLNGLLWSRKPDEDRGKGFRKRKVFLPFQTLENTSVQPPVCCLCHKEYNSEVVYVSCEICEDWFHGAVYRLTLENINYLIGFKCHKCRARSTPICPFSQRSSLAETVTSKYKKGGESPHDGTCQGHRVHVNNDHILDQQKEHIAGTNDHVTSNFNTNELCNVQPFELEEDKIKYSTHHDDGIKLLVASEKMIDDTSKLMEVPELLLSGTLNRSSDPLPQKILLSPHLVDIEGGKS